MARLVVEGVSKVYPGGTVAADGLTLSVASGERFVVVGPSGSGKSTLLRLIAGLEGCDAGAITLGDRRIDRLPPADRDVAMVFQGQVLYPHLNVFENLAFGLRAQRKPRAEVDSTVREIAATLGLTELLERRPATLSGGQGQRVALGRALIVRPGVLLLDEPFAGLDAPLRSRLRGELVALCRRFAVTMVLVTHDQAEAMAVADRLAILDAGRIVQVGPPQAVYDHPTNRLVARFLGDPPMSFLPAEGDGTAVAGIRAEHVRFSPDPVGPATIVAREPTGSRTLLIAETGPDRVAAWADPTTPIAVGDRVRFEFDPNRCVWFDPATGQALPPRS